MGGNREMGRAAAAETEVKAKLQMRTVRRVFGYLVRYKGLAFLTLFCAMAGTVTVIVFPQITAKIINEVVRAHHPERLWPLIWWGLGAFVAQYVFNGLRLIVNNTFEQKVIFDLRSDLYAHLQELPLKWFDNRATGDLMTRVLEDVTSVERMLIDGLEQGVVAILQVVVVTVVLFQLNGKLALLALAPLPLLAAGALTYTLTAHTRYRIQRAASSAMNALLHDNLAGIRQIKTFVREREEHARFNARSRELGEATLVVMRAWALYNPAMGFFAAAGLVALGGFGANEVLRGRLDMGQYVQFLMLAPFLYDPIGRLHQLNQLFQSGRAAGERVFEIMDERAEPGGDVDEEEGTMDVMGEVEYRNVSFAYDEAAPVLRGIWLHAQPGETVALVGQTGAGKSTLVNLLTRFYEYDTGEILVDGRALREMPKMALRRAVGMVTQESFLFNGSVRENLRLGKPGATTEEMLAVLEAANAREFVEAMPKGLDTIVGERGVKLSVGEKQRVSIARALLKDPPILILDEATASVDTATERLIQEALERLMERRTSFVIAHRLSTVRHADQILVLDHGRIVERGKHAELVELGGVYARLCAKGFVYTGGGLIAGLCGERSMRGHGGGDYLTVAFAVDFEVLVEREDNCVFFGFRHPHKTRIRKRHWNVAVSVHQLSDGGGFGGQGERNADVLIGNCCEEAALRIEAIPQKVDGFNEDGLARCEFSIARFQGSDGPWMEFIPLLKECHEETRVEDEEGHLPKPSMYLGLVDMSEGPSLMMPQRSRTRSKAAFLGACRGCFRERLSASRTRADFGSIAREASASRRSFRSSGILQVMVTTDKR
jgi:ABC-type multidrug transport system fused ATPase/permease subunit